jgi:hypothetical protein
MKIKTNIHYSLFKLPHNEIGWWNAKDNNGKWKNFLIIINLYRGLNWIDRWYATSVTFELTQNITRKGNGYHFKGICKYFYQSWELLLWAWVWQLWHKYDIGMTQLWHRYDTVMTWVWHGYDMFMKWIWYGYDMDMIWVWPHYDTGMTWVWHGYDKGVTRVCHWYGIGMK